MTQMQQATQLETNTKKTAIVQRVVDELLAKTLQRGFFGIASIDVCIQDGVIQEIQERIERKYR